MLGKRSRQRGLFEADNRYLEFVGRDSFYGFLASCSGTKISPKSTVRTTGDPAWRPAC